MWERSTCVRPDGSVFPVCIQDFRHLITKLVDAVLNVFSLFIFFGWHFFSRGPTAVCLYSHHVAVWKQNKQKHCLTFCTPLFFLPVQSAAALKDLYKKYPVLYNSSIVCSFQPKVIYRVRAWLISGNFEAGGLRFLQGYSALLHMRLVNYNQPLHGHTSSQKITFVVFVLP